MTYIYILLFTLLIKLLKHRVIRLILRHCGFHEFHHVRDLDCAGESDEGVEGGAGVEVAVFTDFGHADTVMTGRKGILGIGEDFLLEFFAWEEAGVFDFDVFIRDKSGEFDHSFREVCYLYR